MKGYFMQKNTSKVQAEINLIKLAPNQSFDFDIDEKNEDWVKEILMELNENAKDKTPEQNLEESYLSIAGDIEKKNKPDMGEYLLAKGQIECDYVTECVRTLKPMTVELSLSFKICFVDEEMAKTEQFHEVDELFVDGDMYEIYYYTNRTIQFKDMLHEQIFLNYNQYPVLDAESKLDGVEPEESLET
jgi:hypothetical protein